MIFKLIFNKRDLNLMTDKEIMDLHKKDEILTIDLIHGKIVEILGEGIDIFIVSHAFYLLLENLLEAAVKEMPAEDALWLWVKAYNGLKNYKEIMEGKYNEKQI